MRRFRKQIDTNLNGEISPAKEGNMTPVDYTVQPVLVNQANPNLTNTTKNADQLPGGLELLTNPSIIGGIPQPSPKNSLR